MDAREHAVISDLLAEHARDRAITAEDELAADWDRETDRRRHETTRPDRPGQKTTARPA